MNELEFDCCDCGLHVVQIVPSHRPTGRCAGCQWLSEVPNSFDRERLRARMQAQGTIGTGEPDASIRPDINDLRFGIWRLEQVLEQNDRLLANRPNREQRRFLLQNSAECQRLLSISREQLARISTV